MYLPAARLSLSALCIAIAAVTQSAALCAAGLTPAQQEVEGKSIEISTQSGSEVIALPETAAENSVALEGVDIGEIKESVITQVPSAVPSAAVPSSSAITEPAVIPRTEHKTPLRKIREAARDSVRETAGEDLPAIDTDRDAPATTGDVWERIRAGFAMPTLKGRRVDANVKMYARNTQYFQRISERAGKYLFHIVEEVERRGLPTELVLLPFVESAFQPEALSHAKASGLWQFMPATGNVFSLQQNLWKDERRDVLESTRAALDYLERLHAQFGDWQLALAAYNWGEGSVGRAVRRAKAAGRKADYSHLRMPRETANYVPKLEAVKRIVAEPEKYGVTLPEIENSPYFVRLTKSRDIDMKTAASLAEMDIDEFRMLNPGFNLPVIVASHNNRILLPIDNIEVFLDNLASWVNTGKPLSSWILYRVKEGETLAAIAEKSGMKEEELREVNRIPKGRKVLTGSTLMVDANGQWAPEIAQDALDASIRLSPPEVRRVVYRVRRGDTISTIARRHGVSQNSIRKTNRLRNSRLRIGQRLVIVIPPRKAGVRQIAAGKNVHTVRRGETLYSIAKRYSVSVVSIRKLNGLRTTRLSIGQRLKIR